MNVMNKIKSGKKQGNLNRWGEYMRTIESSIRQRDQLKSGQ